MNLSFCIVQSAFSNEMEKKTKKKYTPNIEGYFDRKAESIS